MREVNIRCPEELGTKRKVGMSLQEWLRQRRLEEIQATTDVAEKLMQIADLREQEGELQLTQRDVDEIAAALWG